MYTQRQIDYLKSTDTVTERDICIGMAAGIDKKK